MIFLWLACLADLPKESAILLHPADSEQMIEEGVIEGFLFYNDLRQFGHFSWRSDPDGGMGQRCSFHAQDCTQNYLGAWGFQVEAYQNNRVVASARVKSNGHYRIRVPTNDAYAVRFLLRYCPEDLCFSFQTDRAILYQLWHPQATQEVPIDLDGGGVDLGMVLFQPTGVLDGEADNHVHATNHFASLMELLYIWHGSTGVPFRSDSFGELKITLPTKLDTSGRTRGPSDIQIAQSNGWIKGNKIMHEYGHVLNLRAWDGQYWFDGNSSPSWSATEPQEPHIAFKEGFANFIARSAGNNIRCEGSFDENNDGSFALVGTPEDGLLYPRNVTKFLCDWYDQSDDDDPYVGGYGDVIAQPRPEKIYAILVNTLLYAKSLSDRELSICSFIDSALDLREEVASESDLLLYRQQLEAMAQNNYILCAD